MTISPFNTIKIIFLYKPYDIQIPYSDISDLKIQIVESSINDEFINNISEPDKLKLFILTPQQYYSNREKIIQYNVYGTNAKHTAFLFAENPADLPTILLRKKISNVYNSISVLGNLKHPISQNQFFYEVKNSIYSLFLHSSYEYLESFSFLRELESKAMKDISKAMTNKSFYAKDFLDLVLKKSMEITMADAGFILIKEEILLDEKEVKELNKNQNLNKPLKFIQKSKILNSQKIFLKRNVLDPNHSKITRNMIENKACISWSEEASISQKNGKVISLKKSVPLPEIDFDQRTYKIKSFCAFPIHLPSGEIEGFIILINKRIGEDNILTKHSDIDNYVSKFSSHDMNLLESFTNQTGIALEHTKLINDLKKVFESFTAASIIAIESRDPTTKGHSERVATLTVGLAEAVNSTNAGIYSSLEFSKIQIEEIRYASLLHDFGKIGVREPVLNKEKKLFPHELEKIESRFLSLRDKLHIHILESYINSLMIKKEIPTQQDMDKRKDEIIQISNKLTKFFEVIQDVNEPALLSLEFFDKISEIAATKIMVGEKSFTLLTEKEIEFLSIKKGSLSQSERLEIESHVTHSYNFLIQIPWSNELKDIPEIVYGHHERLDGSGYPRNLKGKNIPVQAKMMAITDIFDALVAQDRPYKKAIPYSRALNILESEVKNGKLDADLFKIFVEAKIGELILNHNSQDEKKQSSVA